MRKRIRIGIVFTAVLLGTAACGDRTVTSLPTNSDSPAAAAPEEVATTSTTAAAVDRATEPVSVSASDEAELQSIEGLLREIEADLASVDQDLRTPEGDPTR